MKQVQAGQTRFQCEVCEQKFKTDKEAVRCERDHQAPWLYGLGSGADSNGGECRMCWGSNLLSTKEWVGGSKDQRVLAPKGHGPHPGHGAGLEYLSLAICVRCAHRVATSLTALGLDEPSETLTPEQVAAGWVLDDGVKVLKVKAPAVARKTARPWLTVRRIALHAVAVLPIVLGVAFMNSFHHLTVPVGIFVGAAIVVAVGRNRPKQAPPKTF